jgi:hypothetical protein
MQPRRAILATLCGAAAAVSALGAAPGGGAAPQAGQSAQVDLSVQTSGGTGTPAAGAPLTFSIHNKGPDDAAGPVELDIVLVSAGATGAGLPDGCTALGGTADTGAPVVHCRLAAAVTANGGEDISIPLAAAGQGQGQGQSQSQSRADRADQTGQPAEAMVHVSPTPESGDVETNPRDNSRTIPLGGQQ